MINLLDLIAGSIMVGLGWIVLTTFSDELKQKYKSHKYWRKQRKLWSKTK